MASEALPDPSNPVDMEQYLRQIAGDAMLKMDTEAHDLQHITEDLIWRVTALADKVADVPEDARSGYTTVYPLTDWDVLEAGYWI